MALRRTSVNSAITHEVPQSRTSLTPETDNMISPGEELRNVQYTPLPTRGRKKQNESHNEPGSKRGQWKGQLEGEMCENKTALSEILRIVADLEKRIFKENRDEMEKEDDLSEEEEPESHEDIAEAPNPELTVKKLRSGTILTRPNKQKPRVASKGPAKQSGRPTRQSMFTGDGKYDVLNFTMPLVQGPKQEPAYRAYKVRDLEALVKQLPPITEGGAAWLRKLRTLTEGEELAIGDFRAIGGRCMLGGG